MSWSWGGRAGVPEPGNAHRPLVPGAGVAFLALLPSGSRIGRDCWLHRGGGWRWTYILVIFYQMFLKKLIKNHGALCLAPFACLLTYWRGMTVELA